MDIGIIEMVLFGIIALCILSVLLVLIIHYRNYFKAKKSWKLEYIAELDIAENMKNNLHKIGIFIKILFGLAIINTLCSIYLAQFEGDSYISLFMPIYLLIFLATVYNSITTMAKKPKYVKLKICDNGILFKDSYKKWSDYKGYYKKGDYLCLILNNGLNNMVQYLKYSEELENIIKTHLNVITNTKDNR